MQFINACKAYEDKIIFRDLNLNFEKNKITALLAPSGYGKTTLLNIIAGLEFLDSGSFIMEAQSISYMFQEDRLLPWLTVYENIAFVLKSSTFKCEIENIIDKYLDLVSLKEYKDYTLDKLSGGMKRRVALARAFAYKSEVLIMDEPFKGIDLTLKKEIISGFLKLWEKDKRTVIVVTHDINEARALSHNIYFLEEYNKL
ncbi:ABC transporter ATP-binding protein [Clostridium botulinum]|uniref:ATP-binding cassette domain-containing protein n=1 Tax=Clostridium botulinum TaxID=1491 RepID=A0A846JBM2_CLOBO|nr:ATP-binding cassette domain-containing protein [Clostridium botulinum]ACA57198.1 ABC transporter, ATP-binding protein [Clostridium botulinum A3 str. Loch Maree]NFH67366.1 ATP-binding cassette domain-containing protein [Clostridium botulinum]NFJ10591.1 ATP-binding cassette domain-containing protein [Clostridium botulinum]NFK15606.1 ATP-binding cassette domain-containing protein [Clostridium botulinum]NFM95728.1 ATP-binding cassette domain-containing protein [Clostridium botulinum]